MNYNYVIECLDNIVSTYPYLTVRSIELFMKNMDLATSEYFYNLFCDKYEYFANIHRDMFITIQNKIFYEINKKKQKKLSISAPEFVFTNKFGLIKSGHVKQNVVDQNINQNVDQNVGPIQLGPIIVEPIVIEPKVEPKMDEINWDDYIDFPLEKLVNKFSRNCTIEDLTRIKIILEITNELGFYPITKLITNFYSQHRILLKMDKIECLVNKTKLLKFNSEKTHLINIIPNKRKYVYDYIQSIFTTNINLWKNKIVNNTIDYNSIPFLNKFNQVYINDILSKSKELSLSRGKIFYSNDNNLIYKKNCGYVQVQKCKINHHILNIFEKPNMLWRYKIEKLSDGHLALKFSDLLKDHTIQKSFDKESLINEIEKCPNFKISKLRDKLIYGPIALFI